MIGFLRGSVHWKDESSFILFHPPVGYEVFAPESTLSGFTMGQTVDLYIHTHVTEDAIRLFGFPSLEERDAFRKILGVSGVGPKIGLAILSAMALDDLIHCVETRDVEQFKKIPGIGAKKAEKILLELEGKLKRPDGLVRASKSGLRKIPLETDLQQALLQLGYRPAEFQGVMAELKRQTGDEWESMKLSNVLPRALKLLSSGRGMERAY